MARTKKAKSVESSVHQAEEPAGNRAFVGIDLGSAAKVIDSKVVQRVYGDALSKPLKEFGGLATDIVKGLRLFTTPFVMAASWKDRLLADLEKCRKRVPEERQVPSPPEIAGPIIERLRFIEDTNPLREMFIELLTSSIDKHKSHLVHPAFPVILSQMSADEAKLLAVIARYDPFFIGQDDGEQMRHMANIPVGIISEDVPLSQPGKIWSSIQRLVGMRLAEQAVKREIRVESYIYGFKASPFGIDFLSACGTALEMQVVMNFDEFMTSLWKEGRHAESQAKTKPMPKTKRTRTVARKTSVGRVGG